MDLNFLIIGGVTAAFLFTMRIPMNHFIEIRTLTLRPGMHKEFHRLYIEQALPLLKRWNFDVVAITAGTALKDASQKSAASVLKPAKADSPDVLRRLPL